MKIKPFLFVLILALIFSCNKSSESKKTGNPVEDLAWLKAEKERLDVNCACIPTIWQSNFKGRTIYEIGCRGPYCNCMHSFYNEDGTAVSESNVDNRVSFLAELGNRKQLWSCEEK